MPYTTLNLGLQLTIPTSGTRNWAAALYSTTWTKISQHRHTGSGDGAQLITSSISDLAITTAKLAANSVTSPKLALNIALAQAATLTPAVTTQTIDWDTGNNQKLNLGSASGDVTVTLSNPQTGGMYRVFLIQGATPRNVLWPASVKWPQGQAPILSTTNGAIDIVELYFDGTNYYGSWDLGWV
jgi:hypothetical protein